MSSGDNHRVLCVGSDVGIATRSVTWTDGYNVKDYDWIFLDFYSLDQQVGDSTISDVLGRYSGPNKSDLFQAVKSGSKVIVLLPEREWIPVSEHKKLYIDRHFPNNFSLISESGRSLNEEDVDSGWEWYFDRPFKWNVLIDGGSHKFEHDNDQYYYQYEGLATNISDEYLACEVLFQRIVNSNRRGDTELKQLTGTVSYLPVIQNWNPSELIKEILDKFTDLDTRVKTEDFPEWAEEKSLPGEDEAASELNELREKKEKIEEKIERKNEELQEFDRYKSLLWGNEDILEQLVPEVFSEFGFNVEGEQPHGRDGMILLEDERFVMEITGTTGGISDNKCRQLSAWVDDLDLENPDHDYTGLLVVNPDRKTRPSDRNPDEFLPPHIRDYLDKRDFHVLLTPDLYDVLSRYRSDELHSDEIHNILSQENVLLQID